MIIIASQRRPTTNNEIYLHERKAFIRDIKIHFSTRVPRIFRLLCPSSIKVHEWVLICKLKRCSKNDWILFSSGESIAFALYVISELVN